MSSGISPEPKAPLSVDALVDIEKRLSGLTLEAAAISKLEGFALSNLAPNTDVACEAVRNGVDEAAAKSLCRHQNLTRFLSHLEAFRKECIKRIAELAKQDASDLGKVEVDRVCHSVQMGIDEALAKPVRGTVIEKLQRMNQSFLARVLHCLHTELGEGATSASEKQVEYAWDDALSRLWKERYKRHYWGAFLTEIIGVGLLAIHGLVYQTRPELGAAALTAGLLVATAGVWLEHTK